MKKFLVAAVCLLTASSMMLQAQDAPKRKPMTDEQKALMKQMTEKYDTNKDGKLDKDERAKISAEDKKKMEDAGLGRKKKDAATDDKKAEPAK